MLQELYERWTEIQNRINETQSLGSEYDRIAEELNILEALRILGYSMIPGERAHVVALIHDRNRRLDEALHKRKQQIAYSKSLS